MDTPRCVGHEHLDVPVLTALSTYRPSRQCGRAGASRATRLGNVTSDPRPRPLRRVRHPQRGPMLGPGTDEVQQLSSLLDALPLHRAVDRDDDFRNPNAVAAKLAYLRNAERRVHMEVGEPGAEDLPLGYELGAAMDRTVMREFLGRWGELQEGAEALRRTSGSAAPATPPEEDDEVTGTSAPIDGGEESRSTRRRPEGAARELAARPLSSSATWRRWKQPDTTSTAGNIEYEVSPAHFALTSTLSTSTS